MPAATGSQMRIFQVAKEIGISHTEIIEFLKRQSVPVQSLNSPISEQVYQQIIAHFAKDRQSKIRDEKEKERTKAKTTRVEERIPERPKDAKESKWVKIMSPSEQRRLEEMEKAKEERGKKESEALQAKEAAEAEKKKQSAEAPVTPETDGKTQKAPDRTAGLREVDITKIGKQIDQGPKAGPRRISPFPGGVRPSGIKGARKPVKKAEEEIVAPEPVIKTLKVREFMTVQEIAKLLEKGTAEILTKCLELGILATINQRLDLQTITLLVEDAGFRAEKMEEKEEDLFSLDDSPADKKRATPRHPVVTIMGHVDHGKTSLLDYIRNSNVVAGEAGGITQHIGAYEVVLESGRRVTFLDTPGHEAFTSMRARGAQVTDVVVLVVAADDGVQPQTVEAISHAKAAGVPIVVAINKMDKAEANPDHVRADLSKHGVQVDQWGGKVQSLEVSAKTGQAVPNLLELIALETDVLDLKANADCEAKGVVVEARLDRGTGAIATVLVRKGTLRVGDPFVCGSAFGKVRSLVNERGGRISYAGPSTPVQVLGFEAVPQAGDKFVVMRDEKVARQMAQERDRYRREIERQMVVSRTLETVSREIREGALKSLPVLLRGDVDGSVEALADALLELPSSEVRVDIVYKAVGAVSESDILLASASKAIVVAYHVTVHSNARLIAKQQGVEIRSYNIIYDAVNDVKLALEGLLEPEVTEQVLGRARVKQLFRVANRGVVAGCFVEEGVITPGSTVRVRRNGEVVFEGTVNSLRHFQDEVKEIRAGKECGIRLDGMRAYEVDDVMETFATKTVKRTLK